MYIGRVIPEHVKDPRSPVEKSRVLDWIGLEISLYSVSNYETLVQTFKVIQWSSFTALLESQNHPHATTIQYQLTYIRLLLY